MDNHPATSATGLDPQARAVIDARARIPADGLPGIRAKYLLCAERFGPRIPVSTAVTELVVESAAASVRHYVPAGGHTGGLLVWAHGGGWIAGSAAGFDGTAAALATHSRTPVVSIDYALAPENPFPRALQQVRDVLAWTRGRAGAQVLGHDPGRVVAGGDSAGANLITVAARDSAEHALAGQVLVYPVTDRRMTRPSYGGPSPILSKDALETCWQLYLGQSPDADGPEISPIDADLAGLPSTLIALAGFDVLHDDGVAYANALRTAGVEVETHTYPRLPHGFLDWAGTVAHSRAAQARVGRFVRAAVTSGRRRDQSDSRTTRTEHTQ
ncbi:alpha/beta hydrolase fold domain-containing protein [Nocardia sp. R6R-6]|uniref:alpha/beta hydrolase fold domain-containing protein n=1 Tax=Nocardia sp. R6R-6 TaxID=3459303 RepID=UPI00403E11E1